MRVLCIDGVKSGDIDFKSRFVARMEHEIYEREIYSVVGAHDFGGGVIGYFLLERPADITYKASRFAPLSNIDEAELMQERQEYETVTQ